MKKFLFINFWIFAAVITNSQMMNVDKAISDVVARMSSTNTIDIINFCDNEDFFGHVINNLIAHNGQTCF